MVTIPLRASTLVLFVMLLLSALVGCSDAVPETVLRERSKQYVEAVLDGDRATYAELEDADAADTGGAIGRVRSMAGERKTSLNYLGRSEDDLPGVAMYNYELDNGVESVIVHVLIGSRGGQVVDLTVSEGP